MSKIILLLPADTPTEDDAGTRTKWILFIYILFLKNNKYRGALCRTKTKKKIYKNSFKII